MYIYVYTYIIYVYIHIYIHMYIYIHIYIHTYIHTCPLNVQDERACRWYHLYYIHVCVCVCVCVCVFACITFSISHQVPQEPTPQHVRLLASWSHELALRPVPFILLQCGGGQGSRGCVEQIAAQATEEEQILLQGTKICIFSTRVSKSFTPQATEEGHFCIVRLL